MSNIDPSKLDEMVDEYQQGKQTVERLSEVEKFVKEQKQSQQNQRAQEIYNATMKEATEIVKSEAGLEVSDRVIKGYITSYADDDPALAQAYANREKDPDAYTKALKKVAEEAKKDLGGNTDGQFARATMSASGHRETAPELAEERQKVQARIAKMSRSEFEAFKKNELPELSAKGVL